MNSQTGPVILEKQGNVARITINKPEKRNPLSREVETALVAALDDIAKDESVRVVTTTGAGDVSFCAGRDVRELSYRFDHPGADPTTANLVQRIREFSKVTIAVVNGYALGMGLTLLTAHDLAIASEENAKFGLPEIMRGFSPRVAIAPLFRSTHTKWAFEMLLSGKNWDAKRAYQAGLINRVVPHDRLHEEAQQWAKEIAQWDPITLMYCKKAAYGSLDVPTYQQAVNMAAFWHHEEHIHNPRFSQGLRDFVEGKGIKADN